MIILTPNKFQICFINFQVTYVIVALTVASMLHVMCVPTFLLDKKRNSKYINNTSSFFPQQTQNNKCSIIK